MLCPGDSPERSFCCGGIEESSRRAGGIFKELKNKKKTNTQKTSCELGLYRKKKD